YLAWWNTMLGAGRLAAPLIITGITVFAPVTVAGAATGAVCVAGGLWLMRVLPRITPSGSTRGRGCGAVGDRGAFGAGAGRSQAAPASRAFSAELCRSIWASSRETER